MKLSTRGWAMISSVAFSAIVWGTTFYIVR